MLKRKTVLLTGATGGIGSEIARLLVANDIDLILVDINKDALRSQFVSLNPDSTLVKTVAADLSTREGLDLVESMLSSMSRPLDVLINCAGINAFSMFEDMTPETIEKLIRVNVLSPIQLTRRLLPYLEMSEQSQIINFGSTLGSIGYPGFSIYCASKFAIRGFTESLRRELANTRISVSYIAPRATRTRINSEPVNKMNEALGVKYDEPAYVASEVLKIVMNGKSQVRHLGWPEKLFVRVNGLLPKLVDNSLRKQLATITRFAKINHS